MRKIKWHVETSRYGSREEGEIAVEDEMTDEEIDEEVREAVFNVVSWGWE